MRRVLLILAVSCAASCSDGGGDLDAFCATAEGFAGAGPVAAIAAADLADPLATGEALRVAADQLRGWAADAPAEVDEETELLATTASDLALLYEDTSIQATDEYVAVEPEAVEAASAAVVAFTRDECGVDLDPVGP